MVARMRFRRPSLRSRRRTRTRESPRGWPLKRPSKSDESVATRSRRHLYVASTGGHLTELLLIENQLPIPVDAAWVTSRSPQSTGALRERRTFFVRPIAPRDWIALLIAAPRLVLALVRFRPTHIFSTGSAIALVPLFLAPLVGAKAIYIESLARTDGPSLTGRILSRIPWVDCWTQWHGLATGRWKYVLNLLESFEPDPVSGGATTSPEPERIFVTLGTQDGYPFTAAVDAVRRTVPKGVEIHWQLGSASAHGLTHAATILSATSYRSELQWGDVIVTHAGVGSLLSALESGHAPVLLPRRKERGEHVDDHQAQIAAVASGLGLAIASEVDELRWENIRKAYGRKIRFRGTTPKSEATRPGRGRLRRPDRWPRRRYRR
jgi:UDP-N-acetylglucosamine--N-acetylmuramyl-(pentapeptide) pyrophosphoryl-undecaprenol N-acetylglucosamine transferase